MSAALPLIRGPRFIALPGLPRLRRGKLNVIAGAGGDNKSSLAVLYAATYSQTGGNVCLISTEDEWEDVLPRLEAADADLSRITFRHKPYRLPEQTAALNTWLSRHGAGLVILDLLEDCKPGRSEFRPALIPLVSALHRTDVTALGIVHTNKHLRNGQSALDVIPGRRGDLAGICKAVFVIARSADDPEGTRYVGAAKWNHGYPPPSLAFAVESVEVPPSDLHTDTIEEVVRLRPVGAVAMDANTILRQAAALAEPDEEAKASARAKAWAALLAVLRDGADHPREDIRKAMEADGYAWATVKRAAGEQGVQTKPDPNDKRRKLWFLPTGVLLQLLDAEQDDGGDDGWEPVS